MFKDDNTVMHFDKPNGNWSSDFVSECIDPRECGRGYWNTSVEEDWRIASRYYPLGGIGTLHVSEGICREAETTGEEGVWIGGWWRRYAWTSGELRSSFEERVTLNIIYKWIRQLLPLTASSPASPDLHSSLPTLQLISLLPETMTSQIPLKCSAILPFWLNSPNSEVIKSLGNQVQLTSISSQSQLNCG